MLTTLNGSFPNWLSFLALFQKLHCTTHVADIISSKNRHITPKTEKKKILKKHQNIIHAISCFSCLRRYIFNYGKTTQFEKHLYFCLAKVSVICADELTKRHILFVEHKSQLHRTALAQV